MNKIELMEIVNEEMLLAEGVGELLKMTKDLAKLSVQKIAKSIRTGWEEFAQSIIASGKEDEALAIINKKFKSNYKNLNQINKLKTIKEDREFLEEDFKHYVMSLKDTVYTSSLVMGMLSIWLELAKLLDNDIPNYKRLAFFGILWIILASEKYYEEWKAWKKSTKLSSD